MQGRDPMGPNHHSLAYLRAATGNPNARWQTCMRVCDIIGHAGPQNPLTPQELWNRTVPEVSDASCSEPVVQG